MVNVVEPVFPCEMHKTRSRKLQNIHAHHKIFHQASQKTDLPAPQIVKSGGVAELSLLAMGSLDHKGRCS